MQPVSQACEKGQTSSAFSRPNASVAAIHQVAKRRLEADQVLPPPKRTIDPILLDPNADKISLRYVLAVIRGFLNEPSIYRNSLLEISHSTLGLPWEVLAPLAEKLFKVDNAYCGITYPLVYRWLAKNIREHDLNPFFARLRAHFTNFNKLERSQAAMLLVKTYIENASSGLELLEMFLRQLFPKNALLAHYYRNVAWDPTRMSPLENDLMSCDSFDEHAIGYAERLRCETFIPCVSLEVLTPRILALLNQTGKSQTEAGLSKMIALRWLLQYQKEAIPEIIQGSLGRWYRESYDTERSEIFPAICKWAKEGRWMPGLQGEMGVVAAVKPFLSDDTPFTAEQWLFLHRLFPQRRFLTQFIDSTSRRFWIYFFSGLIPASENHLMHGENFYLQSFLSEIKNSLAYTTPAILAKIIQEDTIESTPFSLELLDHIAPNRGPISPPVLAILAECSRREVLEKLVTHQGVFEQGEVMIPAIVALDFAEFNRFFPISRFPVLPQTVQQLLIEKASARHYVDFCLRLASAGRFGGEPGEEAVRKVLQGYLRLNGSLSCSNLWDWQRRYPQAIASVIDGPLNSWNCFIVALWRRDMLKLRGIIPELVRLDTEDLVATLDEQTLDDEDFVAFGDIGIACYKIESESKHVPASSWWLAFSAKCYRRAYRLGQLSQAQFLRIVLEHYEDLNLEDLFKLVYLYALYNPLPYQIFVKINRLFGTQPPHDDDYLLIASFKNIESFLNRFDQVHQQRIREHLPASHIKPLDKASLEAAWHREEFRKIYNRILHSPPTLLLFKANLVEFWNSHKPLNFGECLYFRDKALECHRLEFFLKILLLIDFEEYDKVPFLTLFQENFIPEGFANKYGFSNYTFFQVVARALKKVEVVINLSILIRTDVLFLSPSEKLEVLGALCQLAEKGGLEGRPRTPDLLEGLFFRPNTAGEKAALLKYQTILLGQGFLTRKVIAGGIPAVLQRRERGMTL